MVRRQANFAIGIEILSRKSLQFVYFSGPVQRLGYGRQGPLRDEILQHVKRHENAHVCLRLIQPVPNHGEDHAQVGVAFATGVNQLGHRLRGVANERSFRSERQRHRSSLDVTLHGHVTHASEDRLRHYASDVEQREIQTVNGQVLRADIKQRNVIWQLI